MNIHHTSFREYEKNKHIIRVKTINVALGLFQFYIIIKYPKGVLGKSNMKQREHSPKGTSVRTTQHQVYLPAKSNKVLIPANYLILTFIAAEECKGEQPAAIQQHVKVLY